MRRLWVALGMLSVGCSSPETTPGDAASDATIDAMTDATTDAMNADGPAVDAASDVIEEPEDVLAGCNPGEVLPTELRCTGLYASWTKRTIATSVSAFTPGYQLWSDGAEKKRYIQLPQGTQIDVTQLDNWVFPIGTKVWKEFYIQAGAQKRLVETRYMFKGADELWTRVAYVWSEDGSTAKPEPTGVAKVPGTTNYEVPAQQQCARCHGGRVDNIMGFEAISLAAAGASGLTWTELQKKQLVKSTNHNHERSASSLAVPGNATEQAALGYMHMNCGVTCHNPITPGAKYIARLEVDKLTSVTTTSFVTELVNQQSSWVAPNSTAKTYRVRPTDSSRSAIYLRMGMRDDVDGQGSQMPPFGSRQVDANGRQIIKAWIDGMTPQAGYPAPAP